MLSRLYIENIALIERLDLELQRGFNVLTGETGAGKSIIIDSVGLVLGGRADRELIKTGKEKAFVEAVFGIDSPVLLQKLREKGLEAEDGQLILSRELSLSGRNVCRINGRLCSLSVLKECADLLVDLYGQHEHQALLDEDKHIDYLDSFAAPVLGNLLEKVRSGYEQWRELCARLKKGFGTEAERARQADYLQHQVEEIEAANLQIGEEESLTSERAILANAEKIIAALEQCTHCLSELEEAAPALSLLRQACSEMESIASYSSDYEGAKNRLNDAYYQLEDLDHDLRQMKSNVLFDPYRQEEIEARLDTIYKLKRKYGASIEEILAYRDTAEQELLQLEQAAALAKEGEEQKKKLEKELYALCGELSEKRKEQAEELRKAVVGQLADLGMEKARFGARFAPLPPLDEHTPFTAKGLDQIELLLSANPGEELKALHKVASGGEMSRIMLSFKSIEAERIERPVLIFDEIDTGISGRISSAVGEKMCQLARSHQVLCVTHSAQIAAMADAHYLIEKHQTGEKTATTVSLLGPQEHIAEVARIIGGSYATEEGMRHASALIKSAGKIPKN